MNGLVCGEKECLRRSPATAILSLLADYSPQASHAARSSEGLTCLPLNLHCEPVWTH